MRKFGIETSSWEDAFEERVSEKDSEKSMVKEDIKNNGANDRRVNPTDRSGQERPSKEKGLTS